MKQFLNHLSLTTFSQNTCEPHHDPSSFYISLFLCIGLVVSYLPQHYRIIVNKTSEGFSAWFLLLGVVSSTSSLFNIVLLQWKAIVCCHSLSTGACFEGLMGVFQIGLQWAMFSLVFILFLLYFPENRKRQVHRPNSLHLDLPSTLTDPISEEWKVSLVIAALCLGHLALSFVISVMLLIFVGGPEDHHLTNLWAGFLGVFSMILAAMQYFPQIWKTWKRKSVGALSIPMMLLQTPGKKKKGKKKTGNSSVSVIGTALFVYSLMVRPGTNWTAWITYMVTGILQGTLLTLCIIWHFKNKRMGVSDLDGLPEQVHTDERTRLLDDVN
ncbi:uncharacterized protein BX664DRAFT_290382 [Halteromyces radiatus]|uniref:uncharacterized protein n=1 Tax=Halteromyces radiatus TaxID=101107 RepID=UPI0022208776|nr:uncharacterized protein BX664DRAFT_290382 [Halteromyces radiatus]KAI8099959.1 hypothetical protein BX664DRAFT_290382 [Halteromyces radiatus]